MAWGRAGEPGGGGSRLRRWAISALLLAAPGCAEPPCWVAGDPAPGRCLEEDPPLDDDSGTGEDDTAPPDDDTAPPDDDTAPPDDDTVPPDDDTVPPDDDTVPPDDDTVPPDDDTVPPDDDTSPPDGDGDGVPVPGDCDDTDPGVHPGAGETCDGVDQDCDGVIDGGAADAATWFLDWDGDGRGDGGSSVAACAAPPGWVGDSTDCDDSDPRAFPGAWEGPLDGADQDCAPGDDPASLSIAGAVFEGEFPGDLAGAAVASAGDVDGDGIDDVLIASTFADSLDGSYSDVGRVYLFLAADLAAGFPFTPAGAHAVLAGSSAGAMAGKAIGTAGDLDGDGLDEVVVGAPGEDSGGDGAGMVYVVWGDALSAGGERPLGLADARIRGPHPGAELGASVASAGDVDGDGVPDLLVGAPGFQTGGSLAPGRAYVFSGALLAPGGLYTTGDAGTALAGEAADDRAGSAVAAAGDVDGDGIPDVAVGAPGNDANGDSSGRVYVLLGGSLLGAGPGTVSLGSAHVVLNGGRAEQAGVSLAALDLDGDACGDLVVGAPGDAVYGDADPGRAYLVFGCEVAAGGTATLPDLPGTVSLLGESYGAAGVAVASGDVDGDGVDDVAVGGPGGWGGADTTDGAAHLSWGEAAVPGVEVDLTHSAYPAFTGEALGDFAGSSLALVDADGDGRSDLLVGAPGAGGFAGAAGRVYLLWSPY
ncbi:FG-GAP-like repeat-containing protein [Myxococcota bacterium]|nr:FG-GAP-like repeat-containing protein [Myxococcota bacterium]